MTSLNPDYFNLKEMLLEFGNTIEIAGMVLTDVDRTIILTFPDVEVEHITIPDVSLEDWKKIIRQTDIIETEILAKDETGLKKIILRKSARQISAKISWNVFRRDEYKCRYCGRDDVPLTVDHLVLWEEGGPSIEENLVSACKNCNKKRGNMQYKDWLNTDYYKSRSLNLSEEKKDYNKIIVDCLDDIPRKIHVISRGSKKKRK